MKARGLAGRLPPLESGDRFLSHFLPARGLSGSRLGPVRTQEGAPEIPDLEAALVRALEASSTPDLLPSLAEWLGSRYRGGDITIVIDDYARPRAPQRLPPP